MTKREKKDAAASDQAFDYSEAVAELERIARKVEDPGTGIEDIDRYIKKAGELISGCRQYLRTAREKTDAMETY